MSLASVVVLGATAPLLQIVQLRAASDTLQSVHPLQLQPILQQGYVTVLREGEEAAGWDKPASYSQPYYTPRTLHLLRRRRPRPKRCPGPGARGDPPDGAQCPDGHEQGQPAPDRAEPEAASAERHDADRRGRGAAHHERAVVEVARAWLGFGLAFRSG